VYSSSTGGDGCDPENLSVSQSLVLLAHALHIQSLKIENTCNGTYSDSFQNPTKKK